MPAEIADWILINGRILTQDVNRPLAESLAVKGDRLLAVGASALDHQGPDTRVVDAEGGLVLPGFIDCHVHLLEGGLQLSGVQLRDVTSREDFKARLQAYAQTHPGQRWLVGGYWNEQQFPDHQPPTRHWLDAAAPQHLVLLYRHDGHSAVCNTKTLVHCGITQETPDPPGGVIVRDRHGYPTGLLKDAAVELVEKHRPAPSREERTEALKAAGEHLLSLGVTYVHTMCSSWDDLVFLHQAAQAGQLPVRVRAYAPFLEWERFQAEDAREWKVPPWFTVGGLKGFSDGSLGSGTAWMLEPYADEPHNAGLVHPDFQDTRMVKKILKAADEHRIQVVIHAIGDRANRELLQLFEELFQEQGPRDRRWRIEHAQHLHPQDLPRFKNLRVLPSVQPAHLLEDFKWAGRRLGERLRQAYPFASLRNAGARVVFGSDWPVVSADPWRTLYAAVTRGGWFPQEKLSLEEALAAHTREAAYAGYSENLVGRIAPGLLADLVIVDPRAEKLETFSAPPADLTRMVYLGGREVYRK